jgi:protocatechuate 3,4-dioxygenase beta subunit
MQLRICAGVIVFLAAFTSDVTACSCGSGGPPCQNYFEVDAVFIGTVQDISQAEGQTEKGDTYPRRLVRFSIGRAFKGVQGTSVDVFTGQGGGDCGFDFKTRGQYLVYARRTRDGSLGASICSRTRPVTKADEDLRFLENIPPFGTGAQVYGTVIHWEYDLAEGHSNAKGPVQGIPVMLRGPGGAFAVTTDRKGRYEIRGIPPGSYELQAQPPEPFKQSERPWTIELHDARACFAADLSVRYDGRIRGSIVDGDGRPAADVTVEVRHANLAGSSGLIPTLDVRTDAFGTFEFADVSPGRYVVGVGLLWRSTNSSGCYPRTFYPGTPNARDAAVVEIGPGTHHELQPLELPALETHQLTGSVVDQDGRSVEGASVRLTAGEFPRSQLANTVETDSQGGFRFAVCDGLTYVVNAYFEVDDNPRLRFKATTDVFRGAAQTRPLRMVLTPIE